MAKTCRRTGRLFCWLVLMAAMNARGSTPAMTTISDVLYRADGTAARGTLLISWPAFTTADNKPVAAGTMDVALGASGEVQLQLAPNAGANPAGTYYKVVLKLDDGTTNTEYWVVPASSPTTVAAIRSRLAPSSVAVQMVTREYVDSAVASKASDTAVVHKDGAEVINGLKQFTTAPVVPTPQANGDVVNKAYVDAAVVAVGEGSYVRKNGDAMTGPLTLPSDPTAPMQASTRHYVDVTAAGLVPNTALSTTPSAGLVPQAASSPVLDLGWLGTAAGSGDQLLGKTGGSGGSASWWTLPTTGSNGCSGTLDKLLYNSATHALICGSDQTGGGGVSWPLLPPNDNLSDIGDGTHRLRTLYAGTSVNTPKIAGITDTGVVTNLNSDQLDGKHSSSFALGGFSSLAFSATPTFDAAGASSFKMTLTGAVTSATLANATAGQTVSFVLCQDAAGNHTFSWPTNMKGGMELGLQPNKCSAQAFVYDGSQAWALGVVNQ